MANKTAYSGPPPEAEDDDFGYTATLDRWGKAERRVQLRRDKDAAAATRSVTGAPAPAPREGAGRPMLLLRGIPTSVFAGELRRVLETPSYRAERCRIAWKNGQHAGIAGIEFPDVVARAACLAAIDAGAIALGGVTVTDATIASEQDRAMFAKTSKARRRNNRRGGAKAEKAAAAASAALQAQAAALEVLSEFGSALGNIPLYAVDFEAAASTPEGHIPCELGIVRFSLLDGELAHYHVFIDPGEIPPQFRAAAVYTTLKIHGIPYADFHLARRDYAQILAEVTAFCAPHPGPQGFEMPPVLVAKDPLVEQRCLAWMASNARVINSISDRVFDFSPVVSAVTKAASAPALTKAQTTDLAYAMKSVLQTKCTWHSEQAELQPDLHCALGDARAVVSCLTDSLGPLFGRAPVASQSTAWDAVAPSVWAPSSAATDPGPQPIPWDPFAS